MQQATVLRIGLGLHIAVVDWIEDFAETMKIYSVAKLKVLESKK